jgi:hypothetical protein
MSDKPVDCETTFLKNGIRLYWQFNCQNIWLTMETQGGKKYVIDNIDPELSAYTYRLGYELVKEYKSSLLFRSGCAANGPCDFNLIDTRTGKKIKSFGELIYGREDEKFFNCLVYFATPNSLGLYYVDTKKEYRIPIDGSRFIAVIPEYQFCDVRIIKGKLVLSYDCVSASNKREIRIDLTKYHP